MKHRVIDGKAEAPGVLLLSIELPSNKAFIESYEQEFVNLARSNQLHVDHLLRVKLRQLDGAYFLSRGKRAEVAAFCQEHGIDHVVLSEQLSPQQERNLQKALGAKVFDRTFLILEIFEKSAHSAEGKTQVAMAMLAYKKTRLAGRGIHLSQQGGRIGTRGPGETAKEKEIQHIERSFLKLQKELARLERIRATQSKRRKQLHIPLICIIGYTNAGKSTLLNQLTQSTVLAEDRLFATLDTTTRELYLEGDKRALISDTVGFIQQLPHQLISAFKSTLSQLHDANLLLHVIDISDANWPLHMNVVKSILTDLEVERELLFVFNKIDKIAQAVDVSRYEPHVCIDARTKEGVAPLVQFLQTWTRDFIKNRCRELKGNGTAHEQTDVN